ncbi:MAG: DUF948 domain-containing protein [Eubacteriaceae bacterium]
MITLNFSLWEIAVLMVGIAFVVGTVYLVKLLKSLAGTFDETTKLMEDNRLALKSIMENADEITKSSANIVDKASQMVDEVEDSINTVKGQVIMPLVDSLSTVAKVFQTVKSFLNKAK